MKDKTNRIYSVFITVFVIFFMSIFLDSCTIEKPGSGDDFIHSPPRYVVAEKEDGMVVLEWEQIAGAEGYQLFQETGPGDMTRMDDGFSGTNTYSYKEYNYTDTIVYSVRCWSGDEYSSPLSKCSNGIHQTKEEVMKALKPDVESFSVPGEIIIRREANPYATGYILYRYTEPDCMMGTKLYEGKDLSYGDKEVIMGQFYYYKVVNKDTYKTYDASPYAFGIAAYSGKDDYEINETREEATILEHNSTNKATIYNFKDSAGNNLIDDDWYYIVVPPHSEIPIIIEDFTYTLEDDDLFIAIGTGEKTLLKQGSGYKLYNPGNQETDIFFSITVNPEKFYNEFGGYSIIVEE